MRFLKPAVAGAVLLLVVLVTALRCESGGSSSSPGSSSALEATGTIRITDLTATSLKISWDAPKSAAKPEELEYRVFSLRSAETPTLDDALALGKEHTVNWTPGLLALSVTGLTPTTHYWFAVFVQDPQKQLALYPTVDVTTTNATTGTQGDEGDGDGNDDEGEMTKTNLAPVAGTLTATPHSPTSVQLSWTKATDDQTSQKDLEYRVEVTQPVAALKLDWTKDLAALVLADLAPDTSHLIILSVRDAAGLVTAYVPATATTPALPRIALFSPQLTGGGNLGGRAGADGFCESNKPVNLQCPRGLHAFLSVDANDTLGNMPADYDVPTDEPIVNAAGTATVAANWSDLVTMAVDLITPGVLPAATSYWTGSTNGAYSGNACQGWTVGTSLTEAGGGAGNGGSEASGEASGSASGEAGEGSVSGGDPSTSGGGSSGGPPPDSGTTRTSAGSVSGEVCASTTTRLVCVCF